MPCTALISGILKASVLFILGLCCIWLSYPAVSIAAEPQAGSTEERRETERTTEQKLGVIEIYTWTNSLPNDLVDLRNLIDEVVDVNSLQAQVPIIQKQVEEMEWESTTLRSNPNLTYHELTLFESKLTKLRRSIEAINSPVVKNIRLLEAAYRAWAEKESQLEDIAQRVAEDSGLRDSMPKIDSLSEIVREGKKLIEEHLYPILLVGQDIGRIQTRVYVLNDTTSDLVRDMNEAGTQQTSPSMLSAEFYEPLHKEQFVRAWQSITLFLKYQWGYLKSNARLFLAGIGVVLLLAFCVNLTRPIVNASSAWHLFAERPLVTSLFITSTIFSVINTLAVNFDLPPDWETLLYLPLIMAVGMLIENVIKTDWQVTLVRKLLLLIAISLLFTVASLPQVLFYLFVFYASAALLLIYLFQFVRRWARTGQRTITWAILVWGVFPAIIIVAGVSGYDQLAVALFGRILSVVAATLTILLLLLFTSALIELAFNFTPWKLVNQNASVIVSQLKPILALLYGLLWLASVLTILWLYPTLNDAFAAITSLQFSLFNLNITPGSVLTIILIVYATLLISRALRAFLIQEVLPRYKVEKGVQLSIARLVHYATVLVGFFVLLRALGFGLSQITILGGALGVGIGFGLQAIVNNFVSGLILLFERPLKIGDVIEVGELVGEVKELGLRATTVQTYDNAEIVIPNSELITTNLTNWTLAEKRVRIRVPVGVAYGSDIETVLQILLSCAEANPSVLSQPKPAALFLAFGASSLDFELRAWIADFDDRLVVHSELNQDIEAEFNDAGIVIPFPQRDLHIKSIEDDAAAKLFPGSETAAQKT
jgi:small-conductance mechanosensitive channel